MKKLIFLTILGGFTLLFNACYSGSGYVSEQPAYMEGYRTPRPGNDYIWIDGGWIWNKRNHNYEQRNGYWTNQNNKRGYENGRWIKSQRGYRWEERRR